ncbi:GFA family protein [Rhizobium alvei]|uniref:GFA family protein n=1 Tax=Rhizobium alvei TaxID=1132659 RepID=A0ABT8YK52_9HYPH|nr:GFA family protein [Rhizobium alvei]MDO6963625.1 GFA family protein [Rhizobium alvei]
MSTYSGGCQCGAVRYRLAKKPSSPHLCFCRMCQKAAGNYFAALGGAALADFEMTRGTPSWFSSSDLVERGFCNRCGTPLFYREKGGDHVAIMLATLDQPEAVPPEWQSDVYGKTSWFGGLDSLPVSIGSETAEEQESRYQAIAVTNHQHPDHDTAIWPPEPTQ